MQVSLLEVKEVCDRLFDHITKTRGVEVCELEADFYWSIPAEARYSSEEPGEPDVGSLFTDWEMISALLEDDAIPVAYMLTELAPLIAYLGEKLAVDLANEGG